MIVYTGKEKSRMLLTKSCERQSRTTVLAFSEGKRLSRKEISVSFYGLIIHEKCMSSSSFLVIASKHKDISSLLDSDRFRGQSRQQLYRAQHVTVADSSNQCSLSRSLSCSLSLLPLSTSTLSQLLHPLLCLQLRHSGASSLTL
jgi:hypothetical protein